MIKYTHLILQRRKYLVNNDSLKRCYDGCYFDASYEWTQWLEFIHITEEDLESKLKFWRELNDYAVSQRGSSAKCEYRAVLLTDFKK
jgi:hypothetical protein